MSIFLLCMYWESVGDQLYGFNIHLSGIFFSEASLILDKACLQDLQKLEGKSAVSLLMSIS